MPNTDRKLRVFLCHASQDKPVVRELYQRLLAEGWIDPWLDEEQLLPGQDWSIEIEKAVEAADVVIVCLSGKSVTKEGYVQRELKFVLDMALEKPEESIFIIPLRLEECEPPRRLRSWQYAEYFPAEARESAYKRLLASLNLRRGEIERRTGHRVSKEYDRLDNPLHAIPKHRTCIFGEMEFVEIPAGKFLMGSKNTEQEIPYDFWIGRYPVTNSQYARFQRELSRFYPFPKGRDLHPVGNISQMKAEEYIRWLNGHVIDLPSAYHFQLPSEAEWEKAARGTDGRIYPWGNDLIGKCNTRGKNIGETTPVGTYSPESNSPYGVVDMAGNVWEWTRTLNQENIGVLKGGSFADDSMYIRADVRALYSIPSTAASFGMRLAIVPLSVE